MMIEQIIMCIEYAVPSSRFNLVLPSSKRRKMSIDESSNIWLLLYTADTAVKTNTYHTAVSMSIDDQVSAERQLRYLLLDLLQQSVRRPHTKQEHLEW